MKHDPEAFWLATVAAISALLAEDTSRTGRIAAIGCTGFGDGVFRVDAEGRATRSGIVSVDHREQAVLRRLQADERGLRLSAITEQRLWGGQPCEDCGHLGDQLLWAAAHQPAGAADAADEYPAPRWRLPVAVRGQPMLGLQSGPVSRAGLEGRVSGPKANMLVTSSPVQIRHLQFLPYIYGTAHGPISGGFGGQ